MAGVSFCERIATVRLFVWLLFFGAQARRRRRRVEAKECEGRLSYAGAVSVFLRADVMDALSIGLRESVHESSAIGDD